MKPLISIIVPIYNMEEHINKCLESIIQQTLLNIEILCIDDCSTDNSQEKILQYKQHDKRINYFKLSKNSGAGIARNYGLDKAQGEFIAFMDPDDYYYDCYALEHLYSLAINNNVNAVAGNIIKYDQNTKQESPYPKMYFSENGIMKLEEYLFYGAYHRFLFKTSIIKGNNIHFPAYRRRQDPVFFYQIMSIIKIFYATTQKVYTYRVSHKTVPWNYEQISDALQSYIDNTKLLLKQNMYQHYRIEINDFKQKFFMNKTLQTNPRIQSQYQKICQSIHYNNLRKSVFKCLSPFEELSLDKFLSQSLLLDTNTSYIIYGFGNLGNALYEKIKKEHTILGIVDEFFQNLKVDSLKIVSSIKSLDYKNSNIIITILNKTVQKQLLFELEHHYNIKKKNIFLCQ